MEICSRFLYTYDELRKPTGNTQVQQVQQIRQVQQTLKSQDKHTQPENPHYIPKPHATRTHPPQHRTTNRSQAVAAD